MQKRFIVVTAVAAAAYAGYALAQYPILDRIADKVIAKYQGSSCEQLWQAKGQPHTPEEQKVVSILRSDPAMQQHFLNKVAAPIANKMFQCGMIP
jgi:mRNA degradation ribonuclease J1/J2